MEFKKKRKKDIHIDITPLVDTVFILLIFFALSLNFTKTTSFNIKLPEIASNKTAVKSENIIINITSDEKIYLNNKSVDNVNSINDLLMKFKPLKNINLIIEADINVTHGKVVQIMDVCKTAGINRISIAANMK